MTEKDFKKLKKKLDYHYHYFDKSKISPDPLEFPHRFSNYYDIEISAFLSSVFAYGNIKQIIGVLESLHTVIAPSPYKFVMNFDAKRDGKNFNSLIYRFYTPSDIVALFSALKKIYSEYGSLKTFFLNGKEGGDIIVKEQIYDFSNNLLSMIRKSNEITHGNKFMFPHPKHGSACKRMNLFLRWMVRKDELDFGLWNEIPTSKLIIPVDTHVARICKMLGLTKTKNESWFMAEEITENLKRFDPLDPVKYDFAICHIGMRKLKF